MESVLSQRNRMNSHVFSIKAKVTCIVWLVDLKEKTIETNPIGTRANRSPKALIVFFTSLFLWKKKLYINLFWILWQSESENEWLRRNHFFKNYSRFLDSFEMVYLQNFAEHVNPVENVSPQMKMLILCLFKY